MSISASAARLQNIGRSCCSNSGTCSSGSILFVVIIVVALVVAVVVEVIVYYRVCVL
jgi:hypothetical protein